MGSGLVVEKLLILVGLWKAIVFFGQDKIMIDACVVETVEGGFPEVNKFVHESRWDRKNSNSLRAGCFVMFHPIQFFAG